MRHLALILALTLAGPVAAQQLDVQIIERGGGDVPTCTTSIVTGLLADGDGFLAVRTGPGTNYRKIDEVHNGDLVYVFDRVGPWHGVLYDTSDLYCYTNSLGREVPYPGKRGWVHGNWLRDLAG